MNWQTFQFYNYLRFVVRLISIHWCWNWWKKLRVFWWFGWRLRLPRGSVFRVWGSGPLSRPHSWPRVGRHRVLIVDKPMYLCRLLVGGLERQPLICVRSRQRDTVSHRLNLWPLVDIGRHTYLLGSTLMWHKNSTIRYTFVIIWWLNWYWSCFVWNFTAWYKK